MFLDIKLGLVWALIIGLVFGEPLTWGWFVAGVVFALLPDLDFWIEYGQRGTVGGTVLGAHRTLLHNPLAYLPLAVLLYSLLGISWAVLLVVGVLGHLIHDTVGMGFGVRWLWPFSERFYKVFSDREAGIHYDRAHCRVVSWTRAEAEMLAREKGNDRWLREDVQYHLRRLPGHLGKIGLVVIIVALIVWRTQ